jgi:hypothetical protein
MQTPTCDEQALVCGKARPSSLLQNGQPGIQAQELAYGAPRGAPLVNLLSLLEGDTGILTGQLQKQIEKENNCPLGSPALRAVARPVILLPCRMFYSPYQNFAQWCDSLYCLPPFFLHLSPLSMFK